MKFLRSYWISTAELKFLFLHSLISREDKAFQFNSAFISILFWGLFLFSNSNKVIVTTNNLRWNFCITFLSLISWLSSDHWLFSSITYFSLIFSHFLHDLCVQNCKLLFWDTLHYFCNTAWSHNSPWNHSVYSLNNALLSQSKHIIVCLIRWA